MGLQYATIDEFKAVYTNEKAVVYLASVLNAMQKAIQHGVLFNIQCFGGKSREDIQNIVNHAISEYGVNKDKVNSTFYKRFSDVESRSELQLRFEQLAHYMSTYGQGYVGTEGHIYEPEFLKDVDMDVKHQLVYIDVITKDELANKVKTMLTSGIALSGDTQHNLMTIINEAKLDVDYVDKIANREFMCRLCEVEGLLPKNFDEFTRYLIYLTTGSTLLIKSKQTYQVVDGQLSFNSLPESRFNAYVKAFGITQVAKNITRYRKLYLIFRKHFSKSGKSELNKALKLSKKLYIPRKQSPLENVFDADFDEVAKAAKKAPIFKLIKIYNAVSQVNPQATARYFKIRNGKSYLKTDDFVDKVKMSKTTYLHNLLASILQERLGSKQDKVFYIPKGVNYAVPTSAKDFVGSLPYMSKYRFTGKKLSVGIAWEQSADLDLHAMTLDGQHVGWNSSFTGNGITFSGDMTQLNRYGYAAEFLEIDPKKLTEPIIVTASYFNSRDKTVKFDVFSTGAPIDKSLNQGVATQIDGDSVLFHDEVSENDNSSKTLAVIIPSDDGGCDVVYTAINYGNVHVPSVSNATKELIKVLKNQANNTLMLQELIALLGGQVVSDKEELKHAMIDNRYTSEFLTESTGVYAKIDYHAPEIVDLSPDKVTPSTFIDLLKESE